MGNESEAGACAVRRAIFGGVVASTFVASAFGQTRIQAPDLAAQDWFGFDVDANRDVAIVGSWRDDDAGADSGSAHVLSLGSGGIASYVQKLVIEDAMSGDLAGMRVAVRGRWALVSAPGRQLVRDDGTEIKGTVVVFRETNGVWEQMAELDHESRSDGDLFGQSMSMHGSDLLIGAPRDDEFAADGGAVYVFRRTGRVWNMVQKLSPDGLGPHDFFGHDVDGSGNRAMASAYNDDDQGVNAGAVYALSRSTDSVWSIDQKLVSSEGSHFDFFGTSVALFGGRAVVGAPQAEDSDPSAKVNEGAAVVFQWSRTENRWVETFTLRPGDPADEHRFGIDVDVRGRTIVVGASHSDFGLSNSGAVHVFKQHSRDWYEVDRYSSEGKQAYDYLGLSVAIGDSILVGAPGSNSVGGGDAGVGAVDVLATPGDELRWGQTICHSSERRGGLNRFGGNLNSAGDIGRLTAVGGASISRDNLVLRATGLPQDAYGVLVMGTTRRRSVLGDGILCIREDLSSLRFTAQGVGERGRIVERNLMDRFEAMQSGAAGALIGQRFYAQVAYFDRLFDAWNTTNALRIDFAQ